MLVDASQEKDEFTSEMVWTWITREPLLMEGAIQAQIYEWYRLQKTEAKPIYLEDIKNDS